MRAEIYKNIVYPLARQHDPELVHDQAIEFLSKAQSSPFTLNLLELALADRGKRFSSERLHTQVGGIIFENPLMTAAGLDKNGKAVDSMYRLGFGSIVVGTVTQFPQEGKDKPRIFRAGNDSLVNWMGFPNEGATSVALNLPKYQKRSYPLGLSIGINHWIKPEDAPNAFASVVESLYDYFDFAEANVSSPNTDSLTELQNIYHLTSIINAMQEVMIKRGDIKPIFLKISPDATVAQLHAVIQIALDYSIPIVATNTSADIAKSLGFKLGGASGESLRERANQFLEYIYLESEAKIDLIGAGGVKNLSTLVEKFERGAKLLQIYSGFVLPAGGPSLPARLNRELDTWLKAEKKTLTDLW